MQKWEYCYFHEGQKALHIFTGQEETIENAEKYSTSQVIYQLGQIGWELIQIVDAPMGGYRFYYFKRPVVEEPQTVSKVD